MIKAKMAKGKVSFKLNFDEADNINWHVMSFLETESHEILRVRLEKDPARWLMYYVLDEFYRKHSRKLLSFGSEHTYSLERSEALALVWLLRNVGTEPTINSAFELKTTLHKILS